MRSLLGRTAAVTVAGLTLFVGVTAAGAQAEDTSATVECATTTTTPSSSSTSTTSTTSSSSTTSTTVDPCSTTTTIAPEPPAVADTVDPGETSSTTASTEPTTTTTQPPLLVAEVQNPLTATPSRGTSAQVAETLPPPATTTTTTIPRPPENLLPGNSGVGRRVVYRKTYPMRVWLVNSDGSVAKTHLVSGRADWNQPTPGTYSVFSRSSYTCNINNPHICWRYMVRFTKGPSGDNIGFHEIPTNTKTGYKLQSESQLGLALSGGCVRQRTSDAIVMWDFAPVGTKVVVLP
jgi:lipoprotein-anchoring transpeptidase ErfK/SrfK